MTKVTNTNKQTTLPKAKMVPSSDGKKKDPKYVTRTQQHAWFSEKQIKVLKKNHGIKQYIYVTEDGTEVIASMVTDTLEHGCAFDDIKYLGKVDRFVRCEKSAVTLIEAVEIAATQQKQSKHVNPTRIGRWETEEKLYFNKWYIQNNVQFRRAFQCSTWSKRCSEWLTEHGIFRTPTQVKSYYEKMIRNPSRLNFIQCDKFQGGFPGYVFKNPTTSNEHFDEDRTGYYREVFLVWGQTCSGKIVYF